MLELTPSQRRELRARAHGLNPVVSVAGNGLSESVLAEIDRCLKAHELIKVRVYGNDRAWRNDLLTQITVQLECAAVQQIGKLLVLYRPNPSQTATPTTKTTLHSAPGKNAKPKLRPLPSTKSSRSQNPAQNTRTAKSPPRAGQRLGTGVGRAGHSKRGGR